MKWYLINYNSKDDFGCGKTERNFIINLQANSEEEAILNLKESSVKQKSELVKIYNVRELTNEEMTHIENVKRWNDLLNETPTLT